MAAGSVKRRPVDYVGKIDRLDWPGLAALWGKIQDRATQGWAAGKAMEHLVLKAFKLSGADVAWPYRVSLNDHLIEQVDGMVVHDGLTCLVETKDSDANVNVEPLAKLRNQLMRRPAGVVGCAFSRTGFTDPAKTLARFMAPHAVILWQGPEIAYLLEKRDFAEALAIKHRQLLQHGNPDFDTRALEGDR